MTGVGVLGFLIGILAGFGLAWVMLFQPNRKQLAKPPGSAATPAPTADQTGELRRQQAEIADLRGRLAAAEEARAAAEAALAAAGADTPAAGDTPSAPGPAPSTASGPVPETAPTPDKPVADAAPNAGDPQARAPAPAPSASLAEAAAAPATDGQPDDLTRIRGLGPVLKDKLNGLGIKTFRQIADLTEADIARLDETLNLRGRIERDGWVDQARTLAGG